MALQTKKKCTHCGRANHTEPYCWKKRGRPTRSQRKPKREDGDKDVQEAAAVAIEALAPQEPQIQEGIDWVCLMGRGQECTSPLGLEKHKDARQIDSAATSHMTFNRSLFSSYQSVTPCPVQMGDSFTALAVGRGDVLLDILKDGKMMTRELRNVLHVPSFVYSLISCKAWSSSLFSDCKVTNFGKTYPSQLERASEVLILPAAIRQLSRPQVYSFGTREWPSSIQTACEPWPATISSRA